VSADPAPAIGFTITGKPICSAARWHCAAVVARWCFGVRIPAATTARFHRILVTEQGRLRDVLAGTPSP